jgi:hypothetical protein
LDRRTTSPTTKNLTFLWHLGKKTNKQTKIKKKENRNEMCDNYLLKKGTTNIQQ